jgi:hypothetical protein
MLYELFQGFCASVLVLGPVKAAMRGTLAAARQSINPHKLLTKR